MLISEIEIYEVLREKMDQREAKTLIEYIETRVEHKFEHASALFANKDDLHRLELNIFAKIAEGREETARLIAETNLRISELKEDSNKKFAEINLKIAETHTKIAETKNDLIKWIFGMILGATIAIIGVNLTVLKMM